MGCIHGDQPLRIKLTPGGVTHAGSYQDYGGFHRTKYHHLHGTEASREWVPKQKRVIQACRRWRNQKELANHLVANSNEITCKSCMKLMGLIEEPVSAERYIIRKISTGEFYKNTTSRCTPWSDSVYDAFFFRKEHTAVQKCKRWRYFVDGDPLTYSDWLTAGRPRHEHKIIMDPDLEVRPVDVTVK